MGLPARNIHPPSEQATAAVQASVRDVVRWFRRDQRRNRPRPACANAVRSALPALRPGSDDSSSLGARSHGRYRQTMAQKRRRSVAQRPGAIHARTSRSRTRTLRARCSRRARARRSTCRSTSTPSSSPRPISRSTSPCEGDAKAGEEVLFAFELTYAGVFRVQNIPPDQIHPVVMIECPRLLFPFARQIVADAVRNGGFPPLYIDPIDFVGLYRQRAPRCRRRQPPRHCLRRRVPLLSPAPAGPRRGSRARARSSPSLATKASWAARSASVEARDREPAAALLRVRAAAALPAALRAAAAR